MDAQPPERHQTQKYLQICMAMASSFKDWQRPINPFTLLLSFAMHIQQCETASARRTKDAARSTGLILLEAVAPISG
jgi:hypothetical protein